MFSALRSQAVAVAAWAASSPAAMVTIRRRLSPAAMATVDPAATATAATARGMGWVPPS